MAEDMQDTHLRCSALTAAEIANRTVARIHQLGAELGARWDGGVKTFDVEKVRTYAAVCRQRKAAR